MDFFNTRKSAYTSIKLVTEQASMSKMPAVLPEYQGKDHAMNYSKFKVTF